MADAGLMRAARIVAPGRFELEHVPVPEPGPGELVVRVEAALTCGTDLKTLERGHPRVPLPTPMGHEASGIVAAAGEGVADFREGDAVVWAPTAPCGWCRHCLRGRENLCADAVGRMVWGAFADFVRLPAHVVAINTFARPGGLGAAEAAVLEPLATVLRGADRIALDAAETVAILGDGGIALLFARIAALRGAGRVLVIGRHDARLAVAGAAGAEAIRAPDDAVAMDEVRARTGGRGADVVVECVGRVATWELAHRLTAAGGQALMFGGCPPGASMSVDATRLHYEEVDLIGSFHYRSSDVRAALALLADRTVDARPLVTHERALADLEDALALARERAAVKVAILP